MNFKLNFINKMSSISCKNEAMFSEYHQDWALNVKKMIDDHTKNEKKKEIINKYSLNYEDLEYKKFKLRMKTYKIVRKLYLFINRTKIDYFSFQPRILKFWRTVTERRNQFIMDVNNKLINNLYYDKERKYLMLLRTTLQKYDPTYGLQIGLILHRRLNRDVALVINNYLM